MTWLTRTIKLPEDCHHKYEFPGHPDACTIQTGRCTQANCPFVKEQKAKDGGYEDGGLLDKIEEIRQKVGDDGGDG